MLSAEERKTWEELQLPFSMRPSSFILTEKQHRAILAVALHLKQVEEENARLRKVLELLSLNPCEIVPRKDGSVELYVDTTNGDTEWVQRADTLIEATEIVRERVRSRTGAE